MGCGRHTFHKSDCWACVSDRKEQSDKQQLAEQQNLRRTFEAQTSSQNKAAAQQARSAAAQLAAQEAHQHAAAQSAAAQLAVQEAHQHIAAQRARQGANFEWSQYLQTPAGREYQRWEFAATALFTILDTHRYAWHLAWVSASFDVAGPTPQLPVVAAPRPTWPKMLLGLLVASMVLVGLSSGIVVSFVIILVAAFLIYSVAWNHPLPSRAVGTLYRAVRTLYRAVRNLRYNAARKRVAEATDRTIAELAERRVERLGIDDLQIEPAESSDAAVPGGQLLVLEEDVLPRYRTLVMDSPRLVALVSQEFTDENLRGYLVELQEFQQVARTTYPVPRDFPPLRFPLKRLVDPRYPQNVKDVLDSIPQGRVSPDDFQLPAELR